MRRNGTTLPVIAGMRGTIDIEDFVLEKRSDIWDSS